jgi:AbrB family looped-hinge helix DNA binding protein
MMSKASYSRITSKGQVTIPVEVREKLGLKAGDKIQYVLMDGHCIVIPRNRDASVLFGMLKDYAIEGTEIGDYREAVDQYFAAGGKDQAA